MPFINRRLFCRQQTFFDWIIVFAADLSFDHAVLKTPAPIRTLKLSNVGTRSYLDGRLLGNPRCCSLGFGYWYCLEPSGQWQTVAPLVVVKLRCRTSQVEHLQWVQRTSVRNKFWLLFLLRGNDEPGFRETSGHNKCRPRFPPHF